MTGKFLKHKWQRILMIVLLVLLIFILIPSFLINRYWSPILADKLKAELAESTDGLYKVDFSNAELHILRGQIVVYDIKLRQDTAVYNKKKKQGLAPNNLYELQVKRLVLSHIHPFKIYFKKKVDIGRITLTAPELQISYHQNQDKDTIPKDNRTLWQKISKSLKLIHVSEIFLNDVKFKYKDYSGAKLQVSELKEMNLKATDLMIDSATQTDRSRLLYCQDITTELYNYTGKTSDGLYTYKVKSVKLSTQTSRLNVEGLILQPVEPGKFFAKTSGDRFTLHMDSVQVNNFDFLSYHKYHIFNASNVILTKGAFSVYSNPNAAVKNSDRVITFPHVAIRKVKAALNVDTFTMKGVDVFYNEFNKLSGKTGVISFNRTWGKLYNITNNKDSLKKNNITTAKLQTWFMERGKIDLSFAFNLTDAANSYSYKGHLGEMDLSRVNAATMPLAMIKIRTGHINSLDFDIHATNKVSTGTVKLLYDNLKINLLRKDTVKGYSKKGLATFFANNVVISRNNPDDPGKPPRVATVSYIRPYNSPFFKTIWQTLLSGIKPSAGVGKAKEEKVMKEMEEHTKRKREKQLKQEAKERKKKAEAAKKKARN